ncbi:MAG TPA: ATP-binding cassette domain-containing protein, partial [Dongiaceae bacterium]|nr:ATP-binding cassette domain-containing protein [Dongiaceae bacterium]
MLKVTRLSLCYPNGKQALSEVDLDVKPGELVIVLGGNGSGKTTLLRCIARTLAPSAGQVWVDGTELTRLAGEKLRRARMALAMISQHASLVRR